MDYTSASGYVEDGSGRRQYADRNDAKSVQGTLLIAADRNAVQNELIALILAAGLVPSAADETQVLQAIKKILYLSVPVGIPQPWPMGVPPAGWLMCNGAPFSGEQYPILAQVYPALELPDLRGEFIRGWDNGRGIDADRSLLSEQGDAIRDITGTLGNFAYQTYDAAANISPSGWGAFKRMTGKDPNGYESSLYLNDTSVINATDQLQDGLIFDAALQVPTANEIRPRNVAFNYIVRAA